VGTRDAVSRAALVTGDVIELVLPSGRFEGVVQLVLGGVGTRCDLPYDTVDELQLAVAAVLPSARDEQTVVEIETGAAVTVTIGPVTGGTATDAALLRVLDRLVDRVAAVTRDADEWLMLEVSRSDRGSALGSGAA
jgi:hypothetical protein